MVVLLALVCGGSGRAVADVPTTAPAALSWSQTLRDGWRQCQDKKDAAAVAGAAQELSIRLETADPVAWDWMLQDGGLDFYRQWLTHTDTALERGLIAHAAEELGPAGAALVHAAEQLVQAGVALDDPRWLDVYAQACTQRRRARLQALAAAWPALVFTRHFNMGGSHYAYTEGQSDAQAERHFIPGTALCLLEFNGTESHVRSLLEDPTGVIRDPDVSYDGRRVLFAWKKSERQDDYHLYEMDLATRGVRQLTFGLGMADYEGAYLPSGDIVLSSTRCVQSVDCWWTEVSNLYTCDKDGRFLRRLGFDQVHTNYPAVLEDGRVTYTRWEYNDRGQIFPQGLFQMNPDGTGQTALYGNNTFFPTTIAHTRGIPGTHKLIAVASGHHTRQAGKLIVIDPSKGRQENTGVQLVAPVRETPNVRQDAYGQQGDLFAYPYALNEKQYVVTYHPLGWTSRHGQEVDPRFKLYYMDADGRREVLAADARTSCNQGVPAMARTAAHVHPIAVDYRQDTGTFYVQDIYAGPGLAGVPRGTIKKLRVVTMEFRAAAIGNNSNGGVAGGAMSSTPPSTGNGAWDPKVILGTTPVRDDGSAFFTVPARTPVYFQALDEKGYVVQTMRSWSTLQPGENASCVGCHEDKNSVPPPYHRAQALNGPPAELEPFYGPRRGFSFAREIQPILDRHCIACHDQIMPEPRTHAMAGMPANKSFSLLATPVLDHQAKRCWSASYLALTNSSEREERACRGQSTDLVNWISPQSAPPMLPPYTAGAARSGIMKLLEGGHGGARLSRQEMETFAAWIDLLVPFCGDYPEANAWTPEEVARYEHFVEKRRVLSAIDQSNIAAMLAATPAPVIQVEVQMPSGRKLAPQAGPNGGEFTFDQRWEPGSRIVLHGPSYMIIRLADGLPESLLYTPTGQVVFPVPSGKEGKVYPPGAFAADRPRIWVRPAAVEELLFRRNVALNPYDVRGPAVGFPHATASSECRDEPVFAARNAIDGMVENRHHGSWPAESWGPEQVQNAWWQVDFGRPVLVDTLTLYLRADFPHDHTWHAAVLEFSDGTTENVVLQNIAGPQTFTFKPRQVTTLRLGKLLQNEPLGWCALSEAEVFGQDVPATFWHPMTGTGGKDVGLVPAALETVTNGAPRR